MKKMNRILQKFQNYSKMIQKLLLMIKSNNTIINMEQFKINQTENKNNLFNNNNY